MHKSNIAKVKCMECNEFFPPEDFEGEDLTKQAIHKKCGRLTVCPIFIIHPINERII